MRLFFLHNRENLCEKNRDKSDDNKKKYFSLRIEKYSGNTEECSEKINSKSDFLFRKTDFHKTEVEMGRLLSLKRIFSLENPHSHHIDKIDQVDSENCHSSCYFSSSDDRESSNQKSEHNRPRITHNDSSRYISPSEPESRGNYDGEDHQKKSAILDSSDTCIGK